jgi:hypothetical protein
MRSGACQQVVFATKAQIPMRSQMIIPDADRQAEAALCGDRIGNLGYFRRLQRPYKRWKIENSQQLEVKKRIPFQRREDEKILL